MRIIVLRIWLAGALALGLSAMPAFAGYMTLAVPEPSTWSMMILAFAALGFMRRRAVGAV